MPVEIRFDDFDKKAIKILNQIIKKTNTEIVVSSDWKLHATLDELGDYYEAQGIIKRPISITPNLHEFDESTNDLFMWKRWLERKRIPEIEMYLNDNPQITQWVAIDDLNMSAQANGGYGLKNFVLTSRSSEGIKQCDIKEKILSFLKQN
jgi:tetratricopeptide (TPR) repeat protein